MPVQRFRDVLKSASAMEDDDRIYLLLAIEAQSEVNHVMPIRNMVYDALQYAAQVEEAARSHRKARKEGILEELEKKPDAGEYLSGFYRGDRLIPVITLVIYFAPGEWDGPMSLHEISTSLREVMLFIKYSKDKTKLNEMVQQGVQQGIQQGIQQIALRMLKANCFSIEMIAQMTGLSAQEILALQL